MRAKLRSERQKRADGLKPVVQELRLSPVRVAPTISLTTSDLLSGAVHSSMRPIDEGSYRERSEALVRGVPLAPIAPPVAQKLAAPRVSAKDLIAELQSINTQIHRMMFQVERAVANLATAG
jgi:hypothetical protein